MNEKFHELNRGMAVQVVAQKIADGQVDPLASTFEALVAQFQEAVIRVAEDFGVTTKPTKPKRAELKAPATSDGNGTKKRAGIKPEALAGFIGKSQEGAATLQQISEHFGVSKGVAERAVKAIPGVKSALCPKADGQRGKPPTVYWAE